jgi:hypothetical protein
MDEDVDDIEGAEPGLLADFIEALNPEARAMWPDVRRAWKAEVRRAGAPKGTSTRDSLYNAFQRVKGKITAAKLEELVDNAVKKGDAQTLRVLAMLAGEDLTEKPNEAAGPGAQLIILRPHPDSLTPLQEGDIQTQLASIAPELLSS